MLVQTQIAKLRQLNGIDRISALRSGAIRKLQRASQLDRSDEVPVRDPAGRPRSVDSGRDR